MNWKSWPYWVKGGIVGLLLSILLYSYGFILSSVDTGIGLQDYLAVTFSPNERFTVISYMIVGALVLIGIGSGYLYGKIKNRKTRAIPLS